MISWTFIISDNIAETWFLLISLGHPGFFIIGRRKKMETLFICSVGIYRCEKSSSSKINMNMTHHFDKLHSDIYYHMRIYIKTATMETDDPRRYPHRTRAGLPARLKNFTYVNVARFNPRGYPRGCHIIQPSLNTCIISIHADPVRGIWT